MKEMLKEQVIKNSFWNFLTMAIIKIGGLIFTIILTRFLLPEKFGIYSLAMSILLILITISDFGVNQTAVRYLSYALGKKDKKLSTSYYSYLFKIKLLFSIVFAIILLALAYPLSFYIFRKPLLFSPLLILSLYLIIYSLEQFGDHIFYAIKKINFLTIKETVLQTSRICFVLLVFIILASNYHLFGVFLTLILSGLIVLFYFLYTLKKLAPFIFKNGKQLDKDKIKKINKFLVYSAIGGVSAMVFWQIDIIMIGLLLPSQYVGYYNAALTIFLGLQSLLALNLILLPVFTQVNKQKISKGFNEVIRYLFILSLPIIFGSLFLAKYIIKLIYGYAYLPAAYPAYFLAFLVFAIPMYFTLVSLFLAKEKPNYVVKPLLIAIGLNIILEYILISYFLRFSDIWAIAGAAIATTMSKFFCMFYLIFIARKKLNIKVNFKPILKPLFSSIVMLLVLLVISLNIKDMNLLYGLIEVIVGVLVYFLVMFLIKGISKSDILLVKSALKNENL